MKILEIIKGNEELKNEFIRSILSLIIFICCAAVITESVITVAYMFLGDGFVGSVIALRLLFYVVMPFLLLCSTIEKISYQLRKKRVPIPISKKKRN